MEWVVTTGRTLEDAKDAALDELGVDEADAEFEILEEPRQGLFGRQRGEARVRARVRPTVPRPKVDRRDRRRRGGDRTAESRSGAADSRSGADGARRGAGGTDVPAAVGASGGAPEGGGESGGAGAPGPRRRRSRTSKAAPASAPVPEAATMEESTMDEEYTLAEQGEVARQFLIGLLDRFGSEAEVDVAELDEDTVEVRVNGPELGLLIGPKGQTLAAVQDLTRTVVQRRSAARTGRLLVDVAGYRQRRKEALERFTRQVAADVVASGVQKVLEPMTAADRKVVHDTANEIAGVRTTSEGEEPRRRVVILPESSASPEPQESPGS